MDGALNISKLDHLNISEDDRSVEQKLQEYLHAFHITYTDQVDVIPYEDLDPDSCSDTIQWTIVGDRFCWLKRKENFSGPFYVFPKPPDDPAVLKALEKFRIDLLGPDNPWFLNEKLENEYQEMLKDDLKIAELDKIIAKYSE